MILEKGVVKIQTFPEKAPNTVKRIVELSESGFYDFTAKYEPGGSKHILPADLPEKITRKALDHAELAHKTLGCRGITRSDFRYDDTQGLLGGLYFLEIITTPKNNNTLSAKHNPVSHVRYSL